jgi:hypothetical protein
MSSFLVVFGCLYYTSSNSRQVAEFKQNHPLLVMLASLTAGYYLILQVQYLSEYICYICQVWCSVLTQHK